MTSSAEPELSCSRSKIVLYVAPISSALDCSSSTTRPATPRAMASALVARDILSSPHATVSSRQWTSGAVAETTCSLIVRHFSISAEYCSRVSFLVRSDARCALISTVTSSLYLRKMPRICFGRAIEVSSSSLSSLRVAAREPSSCARVASFSCGRSSIGTIELPPPTAGMPAVCTTNASRIELREAITASSGGSKTSSPLSRRSVTESSAGIAVGSACTHCSGGASSSFGVKVAYSLISARYAPIDVSTIDFSSSCMMRAICLSTRGTRDTSKASMSAHFSTSCSAPSSCCTCCSTAGSHIAVSRPLISSSFADCCCTKRDVASGGSSC